MAGQYCRRVMGNGLVVIGVENRALHYFVCDVRAHAGPRFETAPEAGLTNFLEHMLMQGTPAYPDSNALMRAVEDIGGTLDAATNPEWLEVALGVHRKHWRRGLAILAEVLLHPLLEEAEIEPEKRICAQELAEYRDEKHRNISAPELAYTLLLKERLDELGTRGSLSTLQSFNREHLLSQYERYMRADNMVVSLAGAFDFDEVFDELGRLLGDMRPAGGRPRPLPCEVRAPRARCVLRSTERQPVVDVEIVHRSLPLGDERFNAALAGAHILGGGVSSRLFSEVRENRGLVYHIVSFNDAYSDIGGVGTSLTVDVANLAEAFAATLEVTSEFRLDGPTEEELARYQEVVRCSMDILCDQPRRLTDWYGRQELLLRPEKLETPAEHVARTNRLTRRDVAQVMAEALAPVATSPAAVGPFGRAERSRLLEMFPAEDLDPQG